MLIVSAVTLTSYSFVCHEINVLIEIECDPFVCTYDNWNENISGESPKTQMIIHSNGRHFYKIQNSYFC